MATSEMPAHTHTLDRSPSDSGFGNDAGSDGPTSGSTLTTNSTGGGGTHLHTLSLDIKYMDVIKATRD